MAGHPREQWENKLHELLELREQSISGGFQSQEDRNEPSISLVNQEGGMCRRRVPYGRPGRGI